LLQAPAARQIGQAAQCRFLYLIAAFRAQGRLCHLSAINRHNQQLFDLLVGAQHYRRGYGKTERRGETDHLKTAAI
jgi:hypothetical protein